MATKKWLVIDIEDYLKKKKTRKENNQEKETKMCLKKPEKTKRIQEKPN